MGWCNKRLIGRRFLTSSESCRVPERAAGPRLSFRLPLGPPHGSQISLRRCASAPNPPCRCPDMAFSTLQQWRD
jgi:hypothetical protein